MKCLPHLPRLCRGSRGDQRVAVVSALDAGERRFLEVEEQAPVAGSQRGVEGEAVGDRPCVLDADRLGDTEAGLPCGGFRPVERRGAASRFPLVRPAPAERTAVGRLPLHLQPGAGRDDSRDVRVHAFRAVRGVRLRRTIRAETSGRVEPDDSRLLERPRNGAPEPGTAPDDRAARLEIRLGLAANRVSETRALGAQRRRHVVPLQAAAGVVERGTAAECAAAGPRHEPEPRCAAVHRRIGRRSLNRDGLDVPPARRARPFAGLVRRQQDPVQGPRGNRPCTGDGVDRPVETAAQWQRFERFPRDARGDGRRPGLLAPRARRLLAARDRARDRLGTCVPRARRGRQTDGEDDPGGGPRQAKHEASCTDIVGRRSRARRRRGDRLRAIWPWAILTILRFADFERPQRAMT